MPPRGRRFGSTRLATSTVRQTALAPAAMARSIIATVAESTTPVRSRYPPLCADVGFRVVRGADDFGVILGGSGCGEQIAANKIPGVRAALCHCVFTAEIARAHNDANVLVMGAKVIAPDLAKAPSGGVAGHALQGRPPPVAGGSDQRARARGVARMSRVLVLLRHGKTPPMPTTCSAAGSTSADRARSPSGRGRGYDSSASRPRPRCGAHLTADPRRGRKPISLWRRPSPGLAYDTSWRLNERHYGALQGRCSRGTSAGEFGAQIYARTGGVPIHFAPPANWGSDPPRPSAP